MNELRGSASRGRLRVDGPGAHPFLGAAAPAFPDARTCAASWLSPTRVRARKLAQDAHGFEDACDHWRDLLERDDLDVVSVCGPNFVHREIGVAVAESGRHLWIEKPAGRNAKDTAESRRPCKRPGSVGRGFNYRNAPAVQLARELVPAGSLGTIETVEVRISRTTPPTPRALSWRFDPQYAGTASSVTSVSHGSTSPCTSGVRSSAAVTELVSDQATLPQQQGL